MAEITSRGKASVNHKRPKKSTKIDMTAMVDIAFLLLTFFVLTATMSNYYQVPLTMPVKDGEAVAEQKVMTLILCPHDTVKYFVGNDKSTFTMAKVSGTTLRKAIQAHQNKFRPLCQGAADASCWDPIFSIIAHNAARYENIVSILDEMSICGAKKYTLSDFSAKDSLLIADMQL